MNRREKTFWELLDAASSARNFVEKTLRRYDLSTSSYKIMRAVAGAECGSIPMVELRPLFAVENDLARMIDRLETNGWLFRTRDLGDRRRVTVHVTDDGRCLITEVDELAKEAFEEVTRFLDEADMIGLSEHLKTITDSVEDAHVHI